MKTMDGKKAPAFVLEGSDGRKHSLKDYGGQTVVLYFYPKDDTPGCTKEACSFRDLHGFLEEMGVRVFGVSRDSLRSHGRFVSKYGLPFVLLSDPQARTMQAYGAWGEKSLYGRRFTGATRSTVVVGPDGKILKHWPAVTKAEEHPARVLEFLQALH